MVTHLERPGSILSLSQQFKKEEALVRGGEADEPNFRKREISPLRKLPASCSMESSRLAGFGSHLPSQGVLLRMQLCLVVPTPCK